MMGKIYTAAILAVSLSSVTVAATEECIRSAEVEADRIRFVETHLKVATLQCTGYEHKAFASLYGNFVKENRPYLVQSSKSLNTYLKRAGKLPLSSHLAVVANRVSMASRTVSQFCGKSRLAAQYAAKSSHPAMLLALLPVRYEKPATMCQG
ncbi:MAG: hypothetical protein JKY34_00055 [Kordiimonadaceae bacterium]|nr:hypothetical protein [Kordiimonadaceae bacterium]